MDEHRNIEITGLECLRNVVQVHLDFFFARLIVGCVGCHLDRAAIFSQEEVVRDFVLSKAHALVPAMLHFLVF